jgi:hypothetical protein
MELEYIAEYSAAFFYWAIIGGGTIVPRNLRTKGNQKNFSKLFFHSYIHDPFIIAKNSFFKIRSINYDGDGFMCGWGAQTVKVFSISSETIPVNLRLNGIEFSLI